MKGELRVLHVITRLIVGGAQENTVATVLGLHGRPGLSLSLISGLSSGSEGSLENRFEACPGILSLLPSLVRPISPWQDVRAATELTRLMRERRPHIVHTHSGKAGILGRLAARRASIPVIVHTIHGPSFGPFQGPLSNLVFRGAECYAARCTDHFISVADAMTRQYLRAGIGREEQFTRIWSGFDLQPFLEAGNKPSLRSSLGFTDDDFVVVKLARLTELKGHEELLCAAARLSSRCPRLKLLLIGDGPLRHKLETMASRSGLRERVVFAGLVSPGAVPELIGAADVLVHLSRREGLPRALPQALAAGKPVIAYACDGAPEVCVDGETGFLVKPGDIETLCKRIEEIASNPDLGRRLGERGREIVRSRFDVRSMVDAIHELYLQLSRAAGESSRKFNEVS
jgi:glycosyltransferase involved in cell wall biosynthesis